MALAVSGAVRDNAGMTMFRRLPARAGFVLALVAAVWTAVARAETPVPRVTIDMGPRALEEEKTLATTELRIGRATVKAEVAATPLERQQGLMHRRELEEGRGMLFVFPEPRPLSFWMRDTLIPLSIAYIGSTGVIMEIHDLRPLDEIPVHSTFQNLQYALEVPQGWFQKNGIFPGDRVHGLPKPSTATPDED